MSVLKGARRIQLATMEEDTIVPLGTGKYVYIVHFYSGKCHYVFADSKAEAEVRTKEEFPETRIDHMARLLVKKNDYMEYGAKLLARVWK